MSRYDGLIIPRSYSDYINKTDAATLLQALQLSGVMDNAPTQNSNHPAKSGGIFAALAEKLDITDLINAITQGSTKAVTSGAVYTRLLNTVDIFPRSNMADCNTANMGFFCSNDVLNAPDNTTGYIFLLTLPYNLDDNYKVQFCTKMNNTGVYMRNKIAGTWTAWVLI